MNNIDLDINMSVEEVNNLIKDYLVLKGDVFNGVTFNNCPKCCGSYEKSFAHYIEQELCEPLEKYWDFDNIEEILQEEVY